MATGLQAADSLGARWRLTCRSCPQRTRQSAFCGRAYRRVSMYRLLLPGCPHALLAAAICCYLVGPALLLPVSCCYLVGPALLLPVASCLTLHCYYPLSAASRGQALAKCAARSIAPSVASPSAWHAQSRLRRVDAGRVSSVRSSLLHDEWQVTQSSLPVNNQDNSSELITRNSLRISLGYSHTTLLILILLTLTLLILTHACFLQLHLLQAVCESC